MLRPAFLAWLVRTRAFPSAYALLADVVDRHLRQPLLSGYPAVTVKLFAVTCAGVALSCGLAFAAPPLFTDSADPCSEVCTFNLCLTPGAPRRRVAIRPCSGCGDIRIAVRVASQPVRLRIARAVVRLRCFPGLSPCFPCSSDADCDDGDAATRDICLMRAAPAVPVCSNVCPAGP